MPPCIGGTDRMTALCARPKPETKRCHSPMPLARSRLPLPARRAVSCSRLRRSDGKPSSWEIHFAHQPEPACSMCFPTSTSCSTRPKGRAPHEPPHLPTEADIYCVVIQTGGGWSGHPESKLPMTVCLAPHFRLPGWVRLRCIGASRRGHIRR
jgi:hypothetical protein